MKRYFLLLTPFMVTDLKTSEVVPSSAGEPSVTPLKRKNPMALDTILNPVEESTIAPEITTQKTVYQMRKKQRLAQLAGVDPENLAQKTGLPLETVEKAINFARNHPTTRFSQDKETLIKLADSHRMQRASQNQFKHKRNIEIREQTAKLDPEKLAQETGLSPKTVRKAISFARSHPTMKFSQDKDTLERLARNYDKDRLRKNQAAKKTT